MHRLIIVVASIKPRDGCLACAQVPYAGLHGIWIQMLMVEVHAHRCRTRA